MTERLALAGQAVIAIDCHSALIALYQGVARGWDPPKHVSREEHAAAKNLPDSDPLKAFVGFGCSFGGAYFGGYAPDVITASRRAVLHQVRTILKAGGSFRCRNFLEMKPCFLNGRTLYLDPPYRNTSGYSGTEKFDHEHFDSLISRWALLNPGRVFLSEYTAPECDSQLIWGRNQKSTVARCKKVRLRTEKLFLIK